MVTNNVYCQKECVCESTKEVSTKENVSLDKIEKVSETQQEDIVAQESYTQEELDLLSRVIFAEAGSDWITSEHQLAVGSVVLNRVSDDRFPNDLYGVIYQNSPNVQYACTNNGMINKTPDERAINSAKYLLTYGSTIPENVVWQSQSPQGDGVWKVIQGHYFCY